MNNKIFFSIITPVFNAENYLSKCIKSVLVQTFTNWELILVDDGSTDSSGKICDEYKNKYPTKIKVFHKQNKGQLHTRIFGINKAIGNYCVFLDSDDTIFPNTLQTIYNKIQEYNCDCVIYGFERILPNGEKIFSTDDKEKIITDKRQLLHLVLFNSNYNSLWRKAVKRDLFINEDFSMFYDIRLKEDLLQSLGIYHRCKTFLLIPDVLYRYVYNYSSITSSIANRPISISFKVEEKILEFLQKENVFTKQDMQDYHTYCISDFQQQIKQICSHPTSYKDKIILFKNIKQKSYYNNFLISSKYKQSIMPFYIQFRLGFFRFLIMQGCLYIFLKKIFSLKNKLYKQYKT